ncbi:MAG: glycosyltransferase family 4 protein [Methylobacter sp.]|nr:glycosyltransferase family 4 protein [Methylobacter sp.]
MRIAIWWEQDSWGGVDTHLLTLLRNWPDKNDQFVIFFNSDNQGMMRISPALEQLKMVSVVPFSMPSSLQFSLFARVVRHFSLPLRFILMKRRAQRLLASHGHFDALLSDNGGYPGAWGSLAVLWSGAALGFRIRMLLVHHAAITRAALRFSVESLIDLGVQKWATDLVAVSRATRSTLIEQRGFYTVRNPIRVVHNGIDVSLEIEELQIDLRAHLDIPVDSFVVGMVGRLERYKGQEDLILALGELPPERLTKVVAVFIGGGEPEEMARLKAIALKTGVVSQVRFAGYIGGSASMLMRQFDLLAMLTKDFEGFGLTIAEAMWVGTPVLTTMVGAVPEFVSKEIAVMVPPEAPDEVAEALLQVMANSEETRQRAARALLHIGKFSGKVMAQRFHRLLLTSGV